MPAPSSVNARFTQAILEATQRHGAHAPRADVADYEALLGCPAQFNQPCNGVALASAELGLSLIQAGQALQAQLRLLADEMLASLPQGSASARVQQLIRQHPRWGKERIGEALLYYLAVQALRSGQTVAQVGEKLGFSDENAFARAFRRWSGQTPAQFALLGERPGGRTSVGDPHAAR